MASHEATHMVRGLSKRERREQMSERPVSQGSESCELLCRLQEVARGRWRSPSR